MALLEVKDLTVSFKLGSKYYDVVRNLSFQVEKGDSLAIVGESGSGKTTAAMAIMGLLPRNAIVKSGSILFNGVDLVKLSKDEWGSIRWKRIAMVFQASQNALDPVKKIGDQLVELYKYHNKNSNKEDAITKVYEVLKMVNLDPSTFKLYPHELSGGMKQRVVIAASLLLDPELLIADEPTTALDVITQAEILLLLRKIIKEKGLSLIFITHDISLASTLCNKIVIMYGGSDMEQGSLKEIITSPLHPYTKHLLRSLTELEEGRLILDKKRNNKVLEFEDQKINGCPFFSKCPEATEKCSGHLPKRIDLRNRKIRCINVDDKAWS
ncbi:ABC transporter ATP-binding protein [Sulfolobus tengchongensis]|uniref:ABC transporter ATP-binding protein n=1 Tax=Sulfolobus tengchongensis TaxID=207809 RepID=A0AAX4KXK5_9CREN